MKQKVLTDNSMEKKTIKWDGTRFGLVVLDRMKNHTNTTILCPREMLDLIKFGGSLGKDTVALREEVKE